MKPRGYCGSWRNVIGIDGYPVRAVCREPKDHEPPCGWQASVDAANEYWRFKELPMSRPSTESYEPSPLRNVGPYSSADEILRQYNAAIFGIPADQMTMLRLLDMVTGEALLISDVQPSEFEMDFFRFWAEESGMDPMVAQLMASWIIRAHVAGIEKGRAQQG